MYLFETEDFYKDISPDINEMFDTNDYPKDQPLYFNKNIKVIGMFKDELNSKQVNTFVGLRAKLYAVLTEGNVKKICKGIKKIVKDNNITFDDYLICLFKHNEQRNKMNVIRSKQHNLFSQTINKVSFISQR